MADEVAQSKGLSFVVWHHGKILKLARAISARFEVDEDKIKKLKDLEWHDDDYTSVIKIEKDNVEMIKDHIPFISVEEFNNGVSQDKIKKF